MTAMRRAMLWTTVFAVCWAGLERVLGAKLHKRYNLMQIGWLRHAGRLAPSASIAALGKF